MTEGCRFRRQSSRTGRRVESHVVWLESGQIISFPGALYRQLYSVFVRCWRQSEPRDQDTPVSSSPDPEETSREVRPMEKSLCHVSGPHWRTAVGALARR